jgi:hypothetical protein
MLMLATLEVLVKTMLHIESLVTNAQNEEFDVKALNQLANGVKR